jgi:hypothetical protein
MNILISALLLVSSVTTSRYSMSSIFITNDPMDVKNCVGVDLIPVWTPEMKKADWDLYRLDFDSELIDAKYQSTFNKSSYKIAIAAGANISYQRLPIRMAENLVTPEVHDKHLVLTISHGDKVELIFEPDFYYCENGN